MVLSRIFHQIQFKIKIKIKKTAPNFCSDKEKKREEK